MKKALIGYTGFVGGNLVRQMDFDDLYNSKNISQIENKSYDIIICAGVRAEKYLANKYPEQDLEQIQSLIDLLGTVGCAHFVLISTIDVYNNPSDVDEDTKIDETTLHAYGKNRLYMEKWAAQKFAKHTIIRLPALFGTGLKKNFIYDCMTKIPTMIMQAKFEELIQKDSSGILQKCYSQDANGNYIYDKSTADADKAALISVLEGLGFTSLVFTDSRSSFPFYDLSRLSGHIDIAAENNLELVNFATQPVTAGEVAREVFGMDFTNENPGKPPAKYDIKTKYCKLFGGADGYIYDKSQVMAQIKKLCGRQVMKLCISNIAWSAPEDSQVYEIMKRFGVSGLETAPTRLFPDSPYDRPADDIEKAKKDILSYGLTPVAMQSLHFGAGGMAMFEGAESRKALLDYTKKAVLFAENLGAKILVFGSPKLRNINDIDKEYDIALDFFRELGEYAAANGRCVCIEANPKEYNTNFINTTADAHKLVCDVGSAGFSLHVDTSTMIINGENLGIIGCIADKIKHVHISTPFLNGIDRAHDDFYRSFAEILKQNKYKNYASVEMRRTEENNLRHIEDVLRYVSGIFGGSN